jgi:hypothetical protein
MEKCKLGCLKELLHRNVDEAKNDGKNIVE